MAWPVVLLALKVTVVGVLSWACVCMLCRLVVSTKRIEWLSGLYNSSYSPSSSGDGKEELVRSVEGGRNFWLQMSDPD